MYGDAARTEVLLHAGLRGASVVVIVTPDSLQSQLILEQVRELNPAVHVTARSHDEHTQQALRRLGASDVLYGEYELGLAMGNTCSQPCKGREAGSSPDSGLCQSRRTRWPITGLRSRWWPVPFRGPSKRRQHSALPLLLAPDVPVGSGQADMWVHRAALNLLQPDQSNLMGRLHCLCSLEPCRDRHWVGLWVWKLQH
ncbi:NAD-binding protein [Deinococcus taeanensis]|uniref:NAD-binding protein n=1 Tax=Deinococcus taeanensis TaxID=2737050 RepID=UPI002107357C|nr:NAD(P)-binding protein [Deinococcus taeanensis]